MIWYDLWFYEMIWYDPYSYDIYNMIWYVIWSMICFFVSCTSQIPLYCMEPVVHIGNGIILLRHMCWTNEGIPPATQVSPCLQFPRTALLVTLWWWQRRRKVLQWMECASTHYVEVSLAQSYQRCKVRWSSMRPSQRSRLVGIKYMGPVYNAMQWCLQIELQFFSWSCPCLRMIQILDPNSSESWVLILCSLNPSLLSYRRPQATFEIDF